MKSELLRKALMAKMATGGNVDGGDDDAKKSARKVDKIPEGYVEVKDEKGNVVKNEAGDILYKRATVKPFTTPTKPDEKEKKLQSNVKVSGVKKDVTTPIKKKEDFTKTQKVDYVYKPQEKKEEVKKEEIKKQEQQVKKQEPVNKWGNIWEGQKTWSRASQGMAPIYDKSGKKMYYEAIDIPAQWDPKNNRWETAGGWGKPTTLFGVEVDGKMEVFDEKTSPVSYKKELNKQTGKIEDVPYYDYDKLAKTTGVYGKQAEAALQEGPQRILYGYGAAQTQPFKGEYDPSLDVKRAVNKIGESDVYGKSQLINKKKGGIVARYEDGGGIGSSGVGDYNMFNIQAENPNMADMNVSDTGMSDLSLDKNVASQGGAGGKKFDLSKLKGSGPISTVGNLAASGIDTLDRKDGRSSIIGQSTSGMIRGAAQGYEMAGVPGAIIGGILGKISGAAKGKKEKKERVNQAVADTRSAGLSAQSYDPLNPNAQPEKVKVDKRDLNKGIKGIFANGGMVKQLSNSANKINYATGGTIKGPGTGTSDSIVTDINGKGIPEGSFITPAKNNEMAKGIRGYILRQNPNKTAEFKKGGTTNSDKVAVSNGEHLFTPKEKKKIVNYLGEEILEKLAPEAEENKEMAKGGEMIKRADGSYSERGLWDGIRENAGSGKKPTSEMLKQEEKIKAELKKGGYVVKRSSERKGKTHVVIGPDGTKKYFGDSKLGQHPNDPARKKAFYARHEKNLKKNPYFRAFARETWAEGGTVGSTMEKAKGGELSKEKAKTMLHDKKAHGKPLTDKQRKYFGWVAGGKKSMGGIIGKYANGGTMNRDWEWG